MLELARSINHPRSTGTVEPARNAPTYRRLLRPLGAYFDRMHACELTLAEFDSGFFWHFFVSGDLTHAVHGEMPYDEILERDEELKRSRNRGNTHKKGLAGMFKPRPPLKWYSSGYEEILRSLAVKFDADCVSSVLLIESGESWLVRTCLPVPLYVQVNQQRRTGLNYFHDSIYMRQELAESSYNHARLLRQDLAARGPNVSTKARHSSHGAKR